MELRKASVTKWLDLKLQVKFGNKKYIKRKKPTPKLNKYQYGHNDTLNSSFIKNHHSCSVK